MFIFTEYCYPYQFPTHHNDAARKQKCIVKGVRTSVITMVWCHLVHIIKAQPESDECQPKFLIL